MVRRLLRLALRFAVSGFCLLSLLACVGAGWLWWRGHSGHRDRVSFRWEGTRFTLRSRPGLLALTGPPPNGPTAGGLAGAQAGRLRNGDLAWGALVRGGRQNEVQEFTLVVAERSDRPGGYAELAAAGREVGPLLRALEDPDRFVAAHALLVQYLATSGQQWLPDCSYVPLPGRADGSFGATYDGLRLELTPMEPADHVDQRTPGDYEQQAIIASAWADPAQLPALRDSWHERLDVPLWSVPLWQVAAAIALPPLLWLGARTRRAMVLRRRKRLGLCLNCGYDLRGSRESGRCSECGEAVPGEAGVPAAR